MTTPVHVVLKADNAKHAVCHIAQQLPRLSASSVRVRSRLISLTSNNLTYARSGGPPLHWWDAYPVPDSCPAPYNKQEEWGIVPAWGYCQVIDSTIDAIEPGSSLWGFLPASGHAVDLQLTAGDLAGRWTEVSTQRSRLMTIYRQYEQVEASDLSRMKMAALCKPLWSGPNMLNCSVFSDRQIHPFGFGDAWSAQDADLSSAVVISLSASSKTGRALSWEMSRNRDVSQHGPLGLLQLTSAPDSLPVFETSLPVKSASYQNDNAISWISQFKPSRVVVIDFGASDAILQYILAAIPSVAATCTITIVAVGYENKIYTPEELRARLATRSSKVQLNASGLRDQTIKAVGAKDYWRQSDETWARCLADKTYGNISVKTMRAVGGPEGIEGAWSDLCQRKVPPNIGLVVDLAEVASQ